MRQLEKQKKKLIKAVLKRHERHEQAREIVPGFFEPELMEYPEQADGFFDEETGDLTVYFEADGTCTFSRVEQIEKVKAGDPIRIIRDAESQQNPGRFLLLTERGKDVGIMPEDLCDAAAPLYDAGKLVIESAEVSFADPISRRSRHARQAILFVRMRARLIP